MVAALAQILFNEEKFLRLTLPIVRGCFDRYVVVDAGSADQTREVVKSFGGVVIDRAWTNNYADARNRAIEEVEKMADVDWIFFLDADEVMFPEDIAVVRQYMEKVDFIGLARIEFAKDFNHFLPRLYPDWQGRFFKLRVGYHFRNPVHEMVYRNDEGRSAFQNNYGIRLPHCPIYHYGRCKPKDFLWKKYHAYDLLREGKPPDTNAKPDEGEVVDPWEGLAEFVGDHPLRRITSSSTLEEA